MKNFLWYSLLVQLLFQIPLRCAAVDDISSEVQESTQEEVSEDITSEGDATDEQKSGEESDEVALGRQEVGSESTDVEDKALSDDIPLESDDDSSEHDVSKASGKEEALETLGGGPDTSELSEERIGYQGNWIKKNEWIREAEQVQIQINTYTEEIIKQRATFYTAKFKEAENALDDFYMKSKIEKGALEGLVASLEQEIAEKHESLIAALKEKNPDAALDDLQEYEIKEQIAALRASLEQVKADMQAIDEVDRGFEVRFKMIDDVISKTMGSKVQADNYLQQMYDILDDKKVRDYCYKIKEILAQIQAVDTYLKHDLAGDFTKLITTLHEQLETTKASIKKLEEQGLPIAKSVDSLKHKTEDLGRVTEALKKDEQVVEDIEALKKIKKEEPSIPALLYDRLIDVVEWVSVQAYTFFERLFGTRVEKLKVRKAKV